MLEPLVEPWPVGKAMYRGHRSGTDGRRFNPGYGQPTRFAFFQDNGTNVPVFYAGNTVDVAIAETLFHDLPLEHGAALLFFRFSDVAYSRMVPKRDLRLGVLHGDGLRRLGLRNHQLCDTDAVEYPDTVLWAAALHSRRDLALDGLVWMSRQFNREEAVVLFGDRVAIDDFELDLYEKDIPFEAGRGLGTLLIAAERAGVVVQTPPNPFLS